MTDSGQEQQRSYTYLSPDELQRLLLDLAVDESQMEQALQVLSAPDPARIVARPTWEQVAHVAVYLHRAVAGARVESPFWRPIVEGHPAARAMWWHELRQVTAYPKLGLADPLRAGVSRRLYWQAHAQASWEEARYWEAWASVEEEQVSALAFLWTHPRMGSLSEQRCVISELELVGVDVRKPPELELRRARSSYRSKQVTWEELLP